MSRNKLALGTAGLVLVAGSFLAFSEPNFLLFVPGAILLAWAIPWAPAKRCSVCRKSVPIHLGKGDSCPHCGVKWGKVERGI